MISRVWHGWTTPENADTYEDLVRSEVIPGIIAKNIPGFRGMHLLRRALEVEVEFITVMWFDAIENVQAFAGEDYEAAYVPPAAREVLTRFDARSQHYDVLVEPGGG